MCGIVSIFNIKEQTPELRKKALAMSKKIRHRGPDWSGIYCGKSAYCVTSDFRLSTPKAASYPYLHPTTNRCWL